MMLVPVPVLWNLRHDIPLRGGTGVLHHPATTGAWDLERRPPPPTTSDIGRHDEKARHARARARPWIRGRM